MATPQRIGPQEVHDQMQQGGNLLLVCAYSSDEKFQQNHLEGALSLSEFESRMDSIEPEQEIVFYCD